MLLTADGHDALAHIRGIGLAREQASLTNDVPLRAQGLVEACHAALTQAGLALHEIDLLLSDASGEGFFFKERALLLSRLLSTPKPTLPIWSCATTLGHTGAAAGLCNVVWALAARERGYAPGPRVLACAGSELELRAALVFSHPRWSA
jgi:3-oxoacyl-[acyl-carrier-protein] synthase-1